MSSHPEVIRFYTGIEIDPDLIEEAQRECDSLDLRPTESFKVFQPNKKANEILDLVKKQVCFPDRQRAFRERCQAKAKAITEQAKCTGAKCPCDSPRCQYQVPTETVYRHPNRNTKLAYKYDYSERAED